jgi:hypothetical protein
MLAFSSSTLRIAVQTTGTYSEYKESDWFPHASLSTKGQLPLPFSAYIGWEKCGLLGSRKATVLGKIVVIFYPPAPLGIDQ